MKDVNLEIKTQPFCGVLLVRITSETRRTKTLPDRTGGMEGKIR